MLIFVGSEGFAYVGLVGGKTVWEGGFGGKAGAADEGLHHGKFNAPDTLESSPGEVPGFAGPEEGLANTTLKDPQPVGEGGVRPQDVTESAEFTPRNPGFDVHILGGIFV